MLKKKKFSVFLLVLQQTETLSSFLVSAAQDATPCVDMEENGPLRGCWRCGLLNNTKAAPERSSEDEPLEGVALEGPDQRVPIRGSEQW